MSRYPDRVQTIINTLAAQHPDLRTGDDDARRRLTRLVAEQTAFELGPNWGTKRADPARPLSADVIATRDPFVGWDFQVAGAVIAQFPESVTLAGQVFVPVDPVDHLGVAPPGAPPSPAGDPPPADPILARLEAIEAAIVTLAQRPDPPPVAVPHPAYRGRFSFGTMRFTPETPS